MSLEPVGTSAASVNWNYSNPNKEGFCESFEGTVLAIQEVQARTFVPGGVGSPRFWDDGKPVMNMRVLFALPDGALRSWTFSKASKRQVKMHNDGQRACIHMQLFDLTGRTRMGDLIGKTLIVSTQAGSYGAGNPRPFLVQLSQNGPYQPAGEVPEEYTISPLLANDGASGGQYNSPQPPMIGNYYAAPRPQQQPMAQPVQGYGYPQQPYGYQPMPQMQQPYQQQPVQQGYQQPYQAQPMQQPMPQAQPMQQQPMVQQQPAATAPMPQGIDPSIAAAMQQLGATNVQVVDDPVYNDLPF